MSLKLLLFSQVLKYRLLASSSVTGILIKHVLLLNIWWWVLARFLLQSQGVAMVQHWFPFYIGTPMFGDCVISLVLNATAKIWNRGSVLYIARLQLSFIQKAKDKTPLRGEGKPTSKERPQSVLASAFYMFVSFLPWAWCKLGWPRRGRLCFT